MPSDEAHRAPLPERIANLRTAALDTAPVSGLTHTFYRYPARFSPTLAATAIEEFSDPGDTVLDPFVGGGTTAVEAIARGRAVVASDLNSLATFVTEAKTTRLSESGGALLRRWARDTVPNLSYRNELRAHDRASREHARNLNGRSTRHLKKLLGLSLASLPETSEAAVETVARCAILKTAQWALDGRRRLPTLGDYRDRLASTVYDMVGSLAVLESVAEQHGRARANSFIIQSDAASIAEHEPFKGGLLADMVLTSPPYPGIHVLYHRWQVNGRRETPAPYWVAAAQDGEVGSHYTFGDHRRADHLYFGRLKRTMSAVRQVLRPGAYFIQAVAFQDPNAQLSKYLRVMEGVGFTEVRPRHSSRIRRSVPGRKWHAYQKGDIPASREVVLIHRTV